MKTRLGRRRQNSKGFYVDTTQNDVGLIQTHVVSIQTHVVVHLHGEYSPRGVVHVKREHMCLYLYRSECCIEIKTLKQWRAEQREREHKECRIELQGLSEEMNMFSQVGIFCGDFLQKFYRRDVGKQHGMLEKFTSED